jgi:sialidase-1
VKIRRAARALLAGLAGAAAVAAFPGAVPTASADAATTVVYQAGTNGYSCFRIPAIVKANNGDLLAFAEGRKNSCADAGDIDTVVKRSKDNGKTWSATPQIVIQGFGDTKDNPTPVVLPPTADEPDGRVVLLSVMQCIAPHASCGRTPRVSISKDNGTTWAAPQVLTTQLGFTTAPGWLATGPSHASVLTRGAHKGRIVAGMSYQITGKPGTGSIAYSDDRGATWHRGATDESTTLNPQEISLTELPDGRIYASARNNSGTMCSTVERAYAISSDGGQTFSQKFVTEPGLAKTPDVQGSTVAMSTPDTGGQYTRLLFAGPSVCNDRQALRIRSSFDAGGSWTGDTDGFLVWSQATAYSDLIALGTTAAASTAGVLFEAGSTSPYSAIRWATFTDTQLGAPACGAGYSVIDRGSLGTEGTVYLSYNAANGKNCVTTMKAAAAGTATATAAYLQVAGSTRQTDTGSYSWFAGPVTASAAGQCVTWGGSIGTTKFDAPSGHCG